MCKRERGDDMGHLSLPSSLFFFFYFEYLLLFNVAKFLISQRK
jgi:hypothetical protein